MGLRFAFDIGTNSIGWAVWHTGPGEFGPDTPLRLGASGVRIFKDGRNPKDGTSLAAMRRAPKQARKRRDRFVLRRRDLLAALTAAGLMPEGEDAKKALVTRDPYQLRAKALDEALAPFEIGRALIHLNQRRGFKSNRKADRKSNEKGKIAEASARLRETLKAQNCRSLGEFLWTRHRGASHDPVRARDPQRQPTRIRLEGAGAKALYEFYPTRDMVRDEFEAIWASQARFHPALLTEAARETIAGVLFRQRALKPPKIGKCTFVPEEERLPKALPSVEAREIYECLAHLRISTGPVSDRPLRKEERDVFAATLLAGKNVTFPQIRKALKLGGEVKINFEEHGEKGFEGASTAKYLAKDNHFGKRWTTLSLAEKDALVAKLIDEADEDDLVERLIFEDGLNEDAARQCATIPLADGFSRLGPTANAAILDALRYETDADGFVITYAEAVARAGWHHSDERDGEILDRLPYYGKILGRHILPGSMDPADRHDEAAYWGRISNPSVHIGLNQLRKLVNALIDRFGRPDQIAIELARELKQNKEQKERELKQNRDNRAANERRAKQLDELGQPDTPENRIRLRLFEEQARGSNGVAACPYSGRPITIHQLFSHEVEIDHILPVSVTLDDSLANRILCFRQTNRDKRRRAPFQAYGHTAAWADIAARAEGLPQNKRWRFRPDALDEFEKRGGFLGRQLNETKYLSRLAAAYLRKVCVRTNARGEAEYGDIFVTPGQLVGLLRGKWGLNAIISTDANRKNRTDHRHHALDAILIGALTRGLIQRIATDAGRAEENDLDKIFDRIPTPIAHDDFRAMIRASIEAITVSFKPEHGKEGALHEDTAYGLVRDGDPARDLGNVVYRKPLADLNDREIARVRDPKIREWIAEAVGPLLDNRGKARDAKAFQTAMASLASSPGPGGQIIRRVRLVKPEASAVPIKDRRTGLPYKAVSPGENAHLDLVQMRDGSWQGFAASVYEVNQPGWRPVWEREKLGGKLVMRLRKGDAVEIDDPDGIRRVKIVHVLEISANRIRLAAHNEGGKLQERHADEGDGFRWDLATLSKLKERNCRAVLVGPSGAVAPRPTNAS